MGRGSENEFVVSHPLASRLHARIEYRNSRFVLVDQSLNGTFLHRDGMPDVALRRDEIPLDGAGVISLGKPAAASRTLCVKFAVRPARATPETTAMRRRPTRDR
jgi:pSer/pThr/pTyr-binding forkhead associated (FHA) protein